MRPTLTVDWGRVEPLRLDPATTPISADLAPALGGAADFSKVRAIDLEKLPEGFRLQRLIFQASRKAFAALRGSFKGNEEFLVFQLIQLVETFLKSDRLDIPSLFHQDPLRKRILIALNIDFVVQHLLRFVTQQNTTSLAPVYDEENPIGSTGQMRTWYTTKPNSQTLRSHISHVVGDSSWEQYAANIFETRDGVAAYAKNDHLGFQIHYLVGRFPPALHSRFPGEACQRHNPRSRNQGRGQPAEQGQARRFGGVGRRRQRGGRLWNVGVGRRL